jgi:hypothetical protein
MRDIFPGTQARVEEWAERAEVLGVLLVGSLSRGHADDLSDDDLEVLLTDEAHARLAPEDCIEVFIEGEGPTRKIIYDAQLTSLSDIERKALSTFDLDHWPYERARILFDRDGRVAQAAEAAGRIDPDFRAKRLRHATIDAWVANYRAAKTLGRGWEAAGKLLVARGARAMSRLAFALESRWVPLDHWLEAELKTLDDPEQVGPAIVEALTGGTPEPLAAALARLEDRLHAEGVARPAGRRDLFLQLIHHTNAEERAIHGLQ